NRRSVSLDSALVLTRGPMSVSGVLFSTLAPPMGIVTAVCYGGKSHPSLIGQVIHQPGSQLSHLTFLAPKDGLGSSALPVLLDYLASLSGERGAFRLLADVDEQQGAFEALRQVCFATFTRQRIWQLTAQPKGEPGPTAWRMANSVDVIPIRSLYSNLVPGLVQQVEPFTTQHPRARGLVYRQDDEVLAYVELRYGRRGIWLQPFVHPDMPNVASGMVDLVQYLPNRRSRPIYICVRSYQSWLEPAIEDLGAEAGPRQAVMVKHLAIPQKALRGFTLPALERGHPEVSAPIARSENK
ncbi:MAG TPA: hypothetical protein VF498_07735, partial [Anaerolineales bacterium]